MVMTVDKIKAFFFSTLRFIVQDIPLLKGALVLVFIVVDPCGDLQFKQGHFPSNSINIFGLTVMLLCDVKANLEIGLPLVVKVGTSTLCKMSGPCDQYLLPSAKANES